MATPRSGCTSTSRATPATSSSASWSSSPAGGLPSTTCSPTARPCRSTCPPRPPDPPARRLARPSHGSRKDVVMNAVDTVVVGAGHAGLAMSAHLTAGGRDHVVLDRGRTGERWRSERWDSLRLLTPNWTIRLPGYDYRGPDPEGYLTAVELADLLDRYAEA